MKAQVVYWVRDSRILSVHLDQGAVHDFQLFKTTLGKLTIPEWVCLVVDSGYQGIQKHHANSIVPHKKPRGG